MSNLSLSASPALQTNSNRQARTLAQLVEAGMSELSRLGNQNITIRIVAAKADVSAATAYNYFESKNHLFAHLFWERVSKIAPQQFSDQDRIKRIQKALDLVCQQLVDNPELAVAANLALLSTEPVVAEYRTLIGLHYLEIIKVAAGEINDVELEAILLALFGAMIQAGMGYSEYSHISKQLGRVVSVILTGAN